MTERFNLDRVQRSIGSQPLFHDAPTTDALMSMVIALLGEVAVLRDRLDANERLAGAAGGAGPEQVDQFVVTSEVRVARAKTRDAIYDRVLGTAAEKLIPEALQREQAAYEQVLQEVAKR